MRPPFWRKPLLLVTLFICISFLVSAQETTVTGKVTNGASGDPIPFANLLFKGTTVGTVTDFDGNFTIKTTRLSDTLIASYIGYKSRVKVVKKGIPQVVNFQLEEDVTHLDEVVVNSGENPAFEILRKVVRNKDANDKRSLSAYEYDTYTKIEVDVDNISDKFKKRKVIRKITQVLDSVERIAGEDGKPILPIFISESVSKIYYRDNPSLKKELIHKTKLNGVGVEDGKVLMQLIGSSFQEYNFYQNWLGILGKNFVSPIADGWRVYYDYDLTDSVYVGSDFCYRLDFNPKNKYDLAFTGTMWITKSDYALKQIDVTTTKQTDINFIEKLRIQQESAKTASGPWLPIKNRVLVDAGELTKNSAGMLAKFYTSNKNIVINKPLPNAFYENPIQLAEDARLYQDEKYWDTLRHEPLTATEMNVYKMIDTLKSIPIVRTYTDIFKIVLDGYYNTGKVEIGPYPSVIAWNTIEGIRLQGGFKTNYNFSPLWTYTGQFAYGFKDGRAKYSLGAQRILSRKRWTTVSFRMRNDLARIGVDDETLADNPILLTAWRWGLIRRGYYFQEYRSVFQRDLFRGFSQKVSFRHYTFNPTYRFGYYATSNEGAPPAIENKFKATEISVESRYARGEIFIQDGNERRSLGTKWPVISLRYTHGFKGVFNSDFNYDKLRLNITKKIKTGPLGTANVTITGEYIFNTLPYPLLALHLGNQWPFYASVTYNLMNYGEFISDHYVTMRYQQYLEGFLINRIPLLNKLKWRLVATSNVIYGGMRQSNRDLIVKRLDDGRETLRAGYLTTKPYVEVGYGVENIFKVFRVDFVHRLTYLGNPDARNFGVLVSAQLQL